MAPNSPDLNLLDYYVWGAMLEKYHKLQPKRKTTDELIIALQTIWEKLPQEHINKSVANFTKHLTACVVTSSIRSNCMPVSVFKSASSSHHQQSGSFQSHRQTTGEDNARNADKWGEVVVIKTV